MTPIGNAPGRPAPSSDDPADDAALDRDSRLQSDETTTRDWIEAEHSRPDLPEENAEGLDEMDEEVRHQAEDQPLDTPGRS